MHIKFLEYLICPVAAHSLRLGSVEERVGDRIIKGTLVCECAEYPIINGVPRFVNQTNYADSFGFQWRKWPKIQFESENMGKPMSGHTLNMFNKIIGPASDIDWLGKTVLDVGCGSGRFVDLARKRGARVVAMDYSLAVEAAAQNFADDEDVCVIQGNALSPPLAKSKFDGAYSIGVLHHTPNAKIGFEEMTKTIRPGGWCALCVYGSGGHYDRIEVNAWRKLFRILMPVFGIRLPLAYAYIGGYLIYPLSFIPGVGHLLRLIYPTVRLPDIRWRILDTFDSVTPCYQSRHNPYELYQWFRSAGFIDIQPCDWGITSVFGKAPDAD